VITPQAPERLLNIPQDGLVYLNSINIPGFAVSPNTHVPYVESWNVTLAFEAPQATVVELAYVGAKGTHLFLPPVNLNPIPFDLTESYIGQGINPLPNPVNDPLGRLNAAGTAPYQFAPAYLGVKYLGFANVYQSYDSSANSIRHAAAVNVRRRPVAGMTYTANYTFGKSIDEASDAGDIRFVNLNVRSPGHVNFGATRVAGRSVSTFDIRHAFNLSGLYDLPLGRGRTLWRNAPHWANALAGGWTLSGVTRIQGGIPMVDGDDSGRQASQRITLGSPGESGHRVRSAALHRSDRATRPGGAPGGYMISGSRMTSSSCGLGKSPGT
jgi:hypothetical protein